MKLPKLIIYMTIFLLISLLMGTMVPGVFARDMSIEIVEYSISSDLISPDDLFVLDVVLKNNSQQDISELYIELEESSGFSFSGMAAEVQAADLLKAGKSTEVSMNMTYTGQGDGQIPLAFHYIKNGETITEEKYLDVNLEDMPGTSEGEYLRAVRLEDKQALQTSAGSELQAELKIKNTSSFSVQEVLVKVSMAVEAPFSFPGEQMFYFRSLGSGETQTVELIIFTDETVSNGTYMLKLDYQFSNTSGETYTSCENLYIQVAEAKSPPTLTLDSGSDEEQFLVPGEDFQLNIKVLNKGELTAKDISIGLEGLSSETISLSYGSPRQYLDDLEAGMDNEIYYTITAADDIEPGSYPLILEVSYSDQTGAVYSSQQEINLEVIKEEVSSDDPMIILNHYQTAPLQVLAGENFTLYMDFFNTHNSESIQNVKVNLNITQSSENGNIFSLLNSSSTFYINNIEPRQTEQRSLQLLSGEVAEAECYYIIVTMEYEGPEGQEHTTSDIMGITVKPVSRLEVGNIRVTGDMILGQPVNVHCTYYNTGTTMLTNLIIKMEGEFEAEDGSVYIGDMMQNSSGYFNSTLKSSVAGEIEGKLVFSYQDTAGEPLALVEPFTIIIYEPEILSVEDEEPVKAGIDCWYIIIPVLIAGAAAAPIVMRRSRQQEEVSLEDEEQ